MKPLLKPGTPPVTSKDLIDLLSDAEDDVAICTSDDFDKTIESSSLRIHDFGFSRDLDLAIFILNNKRIIQRPLSSFPILEQAEDYNLYQFQCSDYGIHWPDLDEDLSIAGMLRGWKSPDARQPGMAAE